MSICEHLPRLAQRSHLWSLVRSLTHSTNDHSAGHMIMLSGRSDLPPGSTRQGPAERLALDRRRRRRPDPPAEQPASRGRAARAAGPQHGPNHPGPVCRRDGPHRDPWFIEASPFEPSAYGAYPGVRVRPPGAASPRARSRRFEAPSLSLPEGLTGPRVGSGCSCWSLSIAAGARSRASPRPRRSIRTARGPSRS